MVGTRYRLGGTDPQQGLDCSGLVFYTYSQAGYEVPRARPGSAGSCRTENPRLSRRSPGHRAVGRAACRLLGRVPAYNPPTRFSHLETRMIAVFGATGNTGRATVKELQALGEDPLCVIRDPEKAKKVLAPGSRTVVAEITDRAALEKALQGVKSVFVVTGHNPQTGPQQINILEAAKAAGVEFFAKVSGGRALVSPDSPSVVGRAHYAIEEALKSSGLDWCILSPGLFMQNTFTQIESIKADGKIVQPFASDLPLAFVDVRDTGAVGARIVANPSAHAGKVIAFTGALTTFPAFAQDFSAVLGKPIAYVGVPVEKAMEAMTRRGMPEWLVEHLGTIGRIGERGAFSTANTRVIEDIVGRPPLTTRRFVEDHQDMFR
jgi:uncharacterized protein YbjT (DUF2867 family)